MSAQRKLTLVAEGKCARMAHAGELASAPTPGEAFSAAVAPGSQEMATLA